jgi:hypothetical protein
MNVYAEKKKKNNGMTCKLSSPALERLADGDKVMVQRRHEGGKKETPRFTPSFVE